MVDEIPGSMGIPPIESRRLQDGRCAKYLAEAKTSKTIVSQYLNIIMKILYTLLFALSLQTLSAQITITGYNHVALAVKDIQESAKFYGEFLGLEKIEVPEHLKAIRSWFKIAPGQELHLLAGRTFPVTNNDPNLAHFSLTIPDADPVEAYLKEKNYPYLRQKRFDGASQIYIADPDGYFIELNEPKRQ